MFPYTRLILLKIPSIGERSNLKRKTSGKQNTYFHVGIAGGGSDTHETDYGVR